MVFLTLDGEVFATDNVQLVYPRQLRKAKNLEELTSDESFEDKELNAIITEPDQENGDENNDERVKKSLVPIEEEEVDDRVKKSLLNTFPFNQDNQDHAHGHHDHDHHHEGEHSDHHGHHEHHEHQEHHEEPEDTVTPFRNPLSQRNPKPQLTFPFDFLDSSDSSVIRSESNSVPASVNSLNSITGQNSSKKCVQKVINNTKIQY